jgi:Protein of unknown function (DUF2442)
MNPYVQSVRALDDYELDVLFENGERRRFDVKPYLGRGIFTRLRNRGLFGAVRVVAGSIEWPGGLDLSYDTLYIRGKPISERPEGAAQNNDASGMEEQSLKSRDQSVMDKRTRYKSSVRQSISTADGLEVAGKVVKIAQENKIECALCGGLAMHVYGFARATANVNFIAATRLPLPSARELEMGGEAYTVESGEEKEIEVDWIMRADDKKELYEAALAGATSTEDGLPIITTEWMVILKYLAGRGKDQIDLLWLLREEGLVDREMVKQHINSLFGRYAFWPLADMDNLFLEADVMKARDQNGE